MPHRNMTWAEFDKRVKENKEKISPRAPMVIPKGIDALPVMNQIDVDVYNIVEELAELLLSKHKDYGPTNISRAPGGALNGLRVRIHDKIARINKIGRAHV